MLPLLSLLLAATAISERPRDPWVFRCVLDERPRVVVAALSPDLTVAYDTQTCALFKAWSGDVDFTGAVYDTLHGPQPVTRGELLVPNVRDAGARALHLVRERDGEREPSTVRFRGYRILRHATYEQVEMQWELTTPGGVRVSVFELPERVAETGPELNGPGLLAPIAFQRKFRVEGLPDGLDLVLDSHVYRDRALNSWLGTRAWLHNVYVHGDAKLLVDQNFAEAGTQRAEPGLETVESWLASAEAHGWEAMGEVRFERDGRSAFVVVVAPCEPSTDDDDDDDEEDE